MCSRNNVFERAAGALESVLRGKRFYEIHCQTICMSKPFESTLYDLPAGGGEASVSAPPCCATSANRPSMAYRSWNYEKMRPLCGQRTDPTYAIVYRGDYRRGLKGMLHDARVSSG